MSNSEAENLAHSIDRDTRDPFAPDRINLYRRCGLTRFAARCLDEIERLQKELVWKQEALDGWKHTAAATALAKARGEIAMMPIEEREDELQAIPHQHLIVMLLKANPFSGYTMKNLTKRQAVDTLLRFEYGPIEWRNFAKSRGEQA